MTVSINSYHHDLSQKFAHEKARLQQTLSQQILPETTTTPENIATSENSTPSESITTSPITIEHVGSTAIGIAGKNIIDILIGVKNPAKMAQTRDILSENGYTEGHDTHPDRIFMASQTGETGEGDFHIHICPIDAESYREIILFRDYLRAHPEIAQEYADKKHVFARQAGYDRKKYKALKATYVENLLAQIKSQNHQKSA